MLFLKNVASHSKITINFGARYEITIAAKHAFQFQLDTELQSKVHMIHASSQYYNKLKLYIIFTLPLLLMF